MNTLTPDIHSQSEFEELINAIEARLNEWGEFLWYAARSPTTLAKLLTEEDISPELKFGVKAKTR
jgi:hypothetical protein